MLWRYVKKASCFSAAVLSVVALVSCAGMDPAKVDVELKETAPQAKITSYTEALSKLGLMTEIYNTPHMRIQSNPIYDNTGTSGATGGEIPRDITEMLKSTLNAIGGKITFIPYDPAFIQNQMVTGYSNFDSKLIPDVVVSGGITEFDRGLETRGTNTDAGVEAEFTNAPKWFPSKSVAVDYGEGSKEGLARITLDFNLLDFKTMAGIPRINAVNSMEVRKGLSEKELGITLFGPTFGRKGSIKKVQGRHAAVRLLVEVSMLQIIGKYLDVPYWRLIDEGGLPDKLVVDNLSKRYYTMTDTQRVIICQELLFLYGYNVPISGMLDDQTVMALNQFKGAPISMLDADTFVSLYTGVPINNETLGRRKQLQEAYAAAGVASPVKQVRHAPATPAPQPVAAPEPEPAPAPAPVAAVEERPQPAAPKQQPVEEKAVTKQVMQKQKSSIGRKLTEDEW
ncbi:MAG: hypothetical protein JXR59_00420 [Desulfuromonadaceae bacterium]|nr:hypothetical protein [Desulfuromonadaceae bacterium]